MYKMNCDKNETFDIGFMQSEEDVKRSGVAEALHNTLVAEGVKNGFSRQELNVLPDACLKALKGNSWVLTQEMAEDFFE